MSSLPKFIFLLLLPSLCFAENLSCKYEEMNGDKGNVEINIYKNQVRLTIDRVQVSGNNCSVTMSNSKIEAECNEADNSIGIKLNLVNGKFEGMLMSEKAEFFSGVKC